MFLALLVDPQSCTSIKVTFVYPFNYFCKFLDVVFHFNIVPAQGHFHNIECNGTLVIHVRKGRPDIRCEDKRVVLCEHQVCCKK